MKTQRVGCGFQVVEFYENSCYNTGRQQKFSLQIGACSSVDRARGYEPRSRGFDSLLARFYVHRIFLGYSINFFVSFREIYEVDPTSPIVLEGVSLFINCYAWKFSFF